ncbi:MAG: serine hydrolase [Hyphomicrobiaceae bacterium]
MAAAGKAGHLSVLAPSRTVTERIHCVTRLMRDVAVFLSLIVIAASPAMASARYAAMSVDANTGAVLHAEAADEARYPASLTKVMTLYLVFEQMQLGRLRPDTMIRISSDAASVPPSKLGLKPGSTIAVSDAIKALITKSANDIAVAFAEHIAGSEDRFARLMTRKAHELGMNATTFRNANGLPDPEQTTTARDMLTLALRLYDTFPREARHFSIRSFSYAGRNYRNHNAMMLNFAGMDGIKTGYTRASGFNLLASVHRDGRHVLAVVFGGNSASARNARMRVILGRSLHNASPERTRRRLMVAARPVSQGEPTARSAAASAPIEKRVPTVAPVRLAEPIRLAAPATAVAEPAEERAERWRSEVRLAAPIMAGNSVASRLGADNDWKPTVAPDQSAVRRPSTLHAQALHLASPPRFTTTVRQEHPAPRGDAEIQIGAFSQPGEARERLAAARQLSPQLLRDVNTAVPAVTVGGRTLYRARFVGLDAATAASACSHLRRRQIDCLVTRSE